MPDKHAMTEAEQLSAWNEWKKICFVPGCSKPAQQFLRRRVTSAMKKKLEKFNLPPEALNDDLLISVFDEYLTYRLDTTSPPDHADTAQKNGGTETTIRLILKQHKDYVWLKMNQSQDPPMKVLNGKLLGDTGIIMDVMKFLVREYFPVQQVQLINPETGKKNRRFVPHRSLQETANPNNGDSRSLEETLADKCILPPDHAAIDSPGDMNIAIRQLLDKLAPHEKILLLAKLAGFNLYDAAVCNALDRQKSAVCALWEKTEAKLLQWRTDDGDSPKLLNKTFHHLLCQALLADLDNADDLPTQNLLQSVRRCHSQR